MFSVKKKPQYAFYFLRKEEYNSIILIIDKKKWVLNPETAQSHLNNQNEILSLA